MTRVRNATKRPLVRFRTGHITGIRYVITARTGFVRGSTDVEHVEAGMDAVFDPRGEDSGTFGEMGSPRVFTPQVYPEDGLEVVCVGEDAGIGPVWGILDEWDTAYEIREKETPCQS